MEILTEFSLDADYRGFFDFVLGSFEGEAFDFDKIMDLLDERYVFGGVDAVPFAVFARFQEGELGFPETNQRRIFANRLCYFPNREILLLNFFHGGKLKDKRQKMKEEL